MVSAGQFTARAYRMARRIYRSTLGCSPSADRVARSAVDWIRQTGTLRDLTSPVSIDGDLPVFLPKLEIETSAKPQELHDMWREVRRAWERLGGERPFHSVLTQPRYLPTRFASSEDEFWRSGESEAYVLADYLADHGMARLRDASVVEYGCGVGRVTMPLAGLVGQLTAYDLSEPHLKLAQARAAQLARTNVRLVLLTSPLAAEFAPCDLFYSRIVLQHNPPPIIGHVLRRLIRALRPGGIGIFQVPTYRVGYRFRVADYLSSPRPLDMEMHCFPQPDLLSLIAEEGAQVVQVRDDNATGRADLFVSNTFVILRPSGTPVPHATVEAQDGG